MPEISLILLPVFFIVAFVHSSVGLAGGSSYTAIMALLGVPLQVIPSISLSLNTLVSSIGSRNFIKNKHFRIKLWLSFQLSALPFVYIGAKTQLPATIFYAILLITLCLSATRMALNASLAPSFNFNAFQKVIVSVLVGMVLGFLSGSLGIGGGIYLVPCIILLGLGSIKEASAVGAVFILVNSVIGLATKWQIGLVSISMILPALVTVGVGGMLGSWYGAKIWQAKTLNRMLLLILLVAIGFLTRKLWLLIGYI